MGLKPPDLSERRARLSRLVYRTALVCRRQKTAPPKLGDQQICARLGCMKKGGVIKAAALRFRPSASCIGTESLFKSVRLICCAARPIKWGDRFAQSHTKLGDLAGRLGQTEFSGM